MAKKKPTIRMLKAQCVKCDTPIEVSSAKARAASMSFFTVAGQDPFMCKDCNHESWIDVECARIRDKGD